MNCKYCGSSKHLDDNCKINLVVMGVPPEHLFDNVVEADSLEDAIKKIKEIIERSKDEH